MDISVIICTYNRCNDLRDVLESLERQVGTEEISWEVIVVDNNSTDATKDVVDEFTKRGRLNLMYVRERQQGLSFARNRGIAESNGQLIAYTDDDAIADPQWVRVIHETYRDYKFDCMGGKILLLWECPKPSWLSEEMCRPLGLLDHGEQILELSDSNRRIYGGNFVVHRNIIEKVGGFNTDLGRKGKKLIGGEEIDLLRRITEARGIAIYQPEAVIHHKVAPQRLRKSYFARREYNEGVVHSMTNAYKGRIKVLGVPTWIIRRFIKTGWKNMMNMNKTNANERLNSWLKTCYGLGEIIGIATNHWQNSKSPLSISFKEPI